MQRIQKIELVGFKSFCDRTQIVFHQGITAIVGPNGCGKSNIADAISWVVGEQSAKSLRADRMEGVIFSGTQARKATSLAEVVLTLNLGKDVHVPEGLDLNPEAFTVSRRLYRSGESEYYLDGRRCRLKDIQALFEGTGLGSGSYALIEQGRIVQILSSKPSDRRSLIEEAARITLFKSRRYAAEMKLEMAEQNLLRVSDIIREVARQLNSLRRQAAKARRYNRLREELRNMQKLKFGLERRELESKLQECFARFSVAREREQIILSDLARVEASRAAEQEEYRNEEERVQEVRDELAGLRLKASNAQGLLENQGSQRDGFKGRIGEIEREMRAVEERGMLVEREQERLRNGARILGEEIARERAALEAEQSRSEVLQGAVRQTEQQIDELRTFLLNGAGRLSDLRNLRTRCQENLQRISAQMRRLATERDSLTCQRAGFSGELEESRRQADAKSSRQKEVASFHESCEQRAAELAQRLEQVSGELAAEQEEYSNTQHRHASLEEVERRRSNYSEGVQKFLSTQLPGEGLHAPHTLADQVETDPRYEAAVEDYLNDPLQYILVNNLEEAVHNVERLKRIGAGKCTFLSLHNGHGPGPGPAAGNIAGEGIVGYLKDLLEMQPDVREAFERALPELASTVMVVDLPTAFRVAESNPGSNFLTLAGEAYSPRGTLSAVGERKSMAGFLALKREKRELEGKLALLRAKMQATREEVARIKGEQATVAELLKSLSDESRKLDVEAVVIGHEMKRLEGEIAKIDQAEKVIEGELVQLVAERSGFEAELERAAAGIGEIEERSRSGEEELRALGNRLESLRTESAALSRNVARLLSTHAVKEERRSGMEAELKRLVGEAEEVRKRAAANRAEESSTFSRIAELERLQRETEGDIKRCLEWIEETNAKLSSGQNSLAAKRETIAVLEETLRRLHDTREEAMDARGRIEIEKTRLESDLKHLAKSCTEEFHKPIDEITAQIGEADWRRSYEEVSQSYDQLRDRIENFGAVNMRALEEYEELDQRYQFLTKQRADIEQSISDTQKAIAEINRRSVEQFQDAFKHIRENFMEVFQILFRGGQCDLRLLDEGDILESGIDIIAQPPGKRLQNMLLLSGGEKALTAIALLIAIFRYRPSPFCVLDEVDATLDDANVGRFTTLLGELSRETQFLVITHNKQSMEVADTLYGVTMEEPGVSKILSVDLRPRQRALAG